MRRILFTGPRKLTVSQRDKVWEVAKRYLPENFGENCLWVLGDAPGVDTMLGELAQSNDCHYLRLNVKQELQADIRTRNWAYAERSQRMVNSLSAGDIAVGFPNKPCPHNCTPKSPWSGGGSGTWGTLAASKAVRGVEAIVYPIFEDVTLPHWLQYKQLSLFE